MVAVVEHGSVDDSLVIVGKVLEILVVGGDDTKGAVLVELP